MKTAIDTSWYVEQEKRIEEAKVRGALLRRQLRVTFDLGFLYVAEFESGVVKVGKTTNPKSRLDSHAKAGVITNSWSSEQHRNCGETERDLIAFCRQRGQLHAGKEYFRGVPFAIACAYADLLAHKELAKQGMEVAAQRRAYLDRLIAAADGDLSMTWAEAHARLGDGTEIGEVPA